MTTRRLDVGGALIDGAVVPGDVEIDDGRIVAVGCSPAGSRGLVAPGLIDVHVHGCGGVDFLAADTAAYARAGLRLAEFGVTAFQPAFVTAPVEQLRDGLVRLAQVRANGGVAPHVLGAHLEGPFLSPERLGTHSAQLRRDPDADALVTLLDAGPVGEVTLAPELPGALDLVDLLVARGVVVSVGHSDATAAQAAAAAARGARSVTHLFNAMRPLHHREPGLAGWALADTDVHIELIVDGHHLHPDIVRMVWRAAGDRILLVTDGTAASGMPDGRYVMGDIELTVTDGAVRNPAGALAGSALTMIDAVRNTHALGVPLEQALTAATAAPARVLQRDDIGRLHVGAAADVIVLDDRLDVRETLVGGRAVYAA
ncbi:N-acetylglucosamine-6-phosphate deacetylase [soil metagenome]